MMWWRGNGLWLALLVALIFVGAAKLGHTALTVGLVASAVIIYLLRDDESSFYSFPVRYWPPLLLLLAAMNSMGL